MLFNVSDLLWDGGGMESLSPGWWAAVYGVAQSRARLKRLSSSIQKQVGGSLIAQ